MKLIGLRIDQIPAYMQEMQEAFQQGYEAKFGASDGHVLPFTDIRKSLHAPHAIWKTLATDVDDASLSTARACGFIGAMIGLISGN